MREISPELRSDIESFINGKERGVELLSFFYKEVFGRELNTKCPSCKADAIEHLERFLKPKKVTMKNWKWVGTGNVTMRVDGGVISVNKSNCTDYHAEIISRIPKYAHNVVALEGAVIDAGEGKVSGMKLTEVKGTISTSKEAPKDEKNAKVKKAKQK